MTSNHRTGHPSPQTKGDNQACVKKQHLRLKSSFFWELDTLEINWMTQVKNNSFTPYNPD